MKIIIRFLMIITTSLMVTSCMKSQSYLEQNAPYILDNTSSLQNTEKKKIRFIINPKSGTHSKNNIESFIHQYFDHNSYELDIAYTKAPNHATELSRQAAELKYDVVVAIGGDGTINEVGKGLIDSETAMAIVPTGSGNGLARHLKIPKNMQRAIQAIRQSRYEWIDTATINDKIFLGIAGVGFDAHIAWKFSEAKRRGFWSYASLVLKEYPHYKSQEYELIIDGEKISKKAFLLSFANSSQYGNDIKIVPQAQLNDGFLQIAILKNPPPYALPEIPFRLSNESINRSKYYEVIPCKEVVVKQDLLVAHIDGEPTLFEKEVLIKVHPHSLKILVPGVK